jgi:hypothetical protein
MHPRCLLQLFPRRPIAMKTNRQRQCPRLACNSAHHPQQLLFMAIRSHLHSVSLSTCMLLPQPLLSTTLFLCRCLFQSPVWKECRSLLCSPKWLLMALKSRMLLLYPRLASASAKAPRELQLLLLRRLCQSHPCLLFLQQQHLRRLLALRQQPAAALTRSSCLDFHSQRQWVISSRDRRRRASNVLTAVPSPSVLRLSTCSPSICLLLPRQHMRQQQLGLLQRMPLLLRLVVAVPPSPTTPASMQQRESLTVASIPSSAALQHSPHPNGLQETPPTSAPPVAPRLVAALVPASTPRHARCVCTPCRPP